MKKLNRTAKRISISIIILVLVMITINLVIQFAIRVGVTKYLKQNNIETVEIESIRFNILNFKSSITGFEYLVSGNEAAKIEKLSINIDPSALLKKKIKIKEFYLKGLSLNVVMNPDVIDINGLRIPKAKTSTTSTVTTEDSKLSVQILGPLIIEDSGLIISKAGKETTVYVSSVKLEGGIIASKAPATIDGSLSLLINGLSINAGSKVLIKQISLNSIGYVNRHLILGDILLDSVQLNILRTQSKKKAKTGTKRVKTNKNLKNSLVFNFLNIEGDSFFKFNDSMVNPEYETVVPFKINVTAIDTSSKNLTTSINLIFNLDKYAKLQSSGTMNVYSKELSLTGLISNFSLEGLYPYSNQYLGYTIKSGKLNDKISLKIKDNIINFDNDLRISKIDLVSYNKKNQGVFENFIGMPLNVALGLITDSEDNIDLIIPLKGTLPSPKAQVTKIIQEAIFKAVNNNSIGFLATLGIELITGLALPPGTQLLSAHLLKQFSKIQFDPLYFEANSVVLDSHVQTDLSHIVDVLNKRPKTKLLICATATLLDAETKYGEAFTSNDLKENTAQLLALADKRSQLVMDYFVSKKIHNSRLFICGSEYINDSISPNVKLVM